MTSRAAAVLRNCSRCCPTPQSRWIHPLTRSAPRRQNVTVQYRQLSQTVLFKSEDQTTQSAERPQTEDRDTIRSDSDTDGSTEPTRGEEEQPASRLVELKDSDLDEDLHETTEAADILRSYLGKPAPEQSEDDLVDVRSSMDDAASSGGGRDRWQEPYRGFSSTLLTQPEIGMDALGHPIGALMLRNPNMIRQAPRYSELPVLERDEAIKPFEIQDGIETEESSTPVSQTELFRNIEEQRPSDRNVISSYEFGKILDTLTDGFTWAQLSTYRKHKTFESRGSIPLSPHKWIHTQTGWASAAPAQVLAKGKAKARLAWHIVTRCWGIASQDQVDAVGTNTIFLRPEVEWLFKRSTSPAFELIRRDYLDETNGESIHQYFSTIKNKRAVHLESKRSTMNTVLEKLDSMITSIVSRSIEGYGGILTRDVASLPNLELLGALTDTKIETYGAEGKKTLKVYWVPSATRPAPSKEASVAAKHEDPADIVLRLLLNARDEQTRDAEQLDIFRPKPEETIAPVSYSRQSRGKPIMHQFVANYSRPSIPIPRRASPSTAQNPFDSQERMESLTQHLDLTRRQRASSRAYVTFGHVLGLGENVETKLAQINQAQGAAWGAVKSKRAFLPWAPHPAALTAATADLDPSKIKRSTAIILNYRKDPSLPKGKRSILPIQITIPVDPTDKSELINVTDNAVVEAYSSKQQDMCFSNRPVDARLIADQRYRLERTKDVQGLLDACTISLADGYLGIPSRAVFSVPATRRMQQSGKTDYIYTGLEIRQSVEVPWKGHILRYNSVEGGLAGGQRQEIVLETDLTPSTAGDELGHRLKNADILAHRKENLQSLLNLAMEVADGRHFSWVNGKAEMGIWTPPTDKHENQEPDYTEHDDVDTPHSASPKLKVRRDDGHRTFHRSDNSPESLIRRLMREEPTADGLQDSTHVEDSPGPDSSISNKPEPQPEIIGLDATNQILGVGEEQNPSVRSMNTEELRSLAEEARAGDGEGPSRVRNHNDGAGRRNRGHRGGRRDKGDRPSRNPRKPALDPEDPFSAVINRRRG